MNLKSLNKSFFRQFVYAFVVLAMSAFLFGCGSSSSSDGGTDSIPLTSPSPDITAKDQSLDVAWTKVGAIQEVDATYEVWISTNEAFTGAEKFEDVTAGSSMLVTSSVSSFGGSPLINGTTYYIRLRAIYAGIGEAPFGEHKPGTPVGVPVTPANVSSETGWDGILPITWDASEYASSYKVYWEEDSSQTEPSSAANIKVVTQPSALITGVTNGTSYRVWVQAVNTAGDSGLTSTTASAAPAAAVPALPLISSVTPISKGLIVRWDAVSLAGSYEVRYSAIDDVSGAQSITVAPESGTVSAKIDELTNGQVYYVWVSASNSVGDSAFSLPETGTPASKAAVTPINYSDMSFILGTAEAEYIWAEQVPASLFFPTGRFSDRLSRFKETAIANLFTDAAAWYVRDQHEPVDFVFLNGGFIEGSIAAGELKLSSILKIIDEDAREDKLVVLTLTGDKVIELFRQAAAQRHTGRGNSGTGGWAVVSEEINYTIQYKALDPALTELTNADEYYRGWIKENTLKFNGEDIVPAQEYRIVTTAYLADGQEGYLAFLSATNRSNYNEYFWQTVAHYIYEMGSVTPYLDGRIHLIGGVPLQTPGWEEGDLLWTPPYPITNYWQ